MIAFKTGAALLVSAWFVTAFWLASAGAAVIASRFEKADAWFEAESAQRRQGAAESAVSAKSALSSAAESSAAAETGLAPVAGVLLEDAQGRPAETRVETPEGRLVTLYAYDAAGRIVLENATLSSGGTVVRSVERRHTYDSASRLSLWREITRRPSGSPASVEVQKKWCYDGRGFQTGYVGVRIERYPGRTFYKDLMGSVSNDPAGRLVRIVENEKSVHGVRYDPMNETVTAIAWLGPSKRRESTYRPRVVNGTVVRAGELASRAADADRTRVVESRRGGVELSLEETVRTFDAAGFTASAQETRYTWGPPEPPPASQTAVKVAAWFAANTGSTPSGLAVSHPDDPNFVYHNGIVAEWAKIPANTQAYSYDQALAGMTLLDGGQAAAAKRIFDFFHVEWQKEGTAFNGFYTVYNVDPAIHWKRYEWRKGMGENAWIALFALRYHAAAADPAEKAKALGLAKAVASWIGTLPHKDGIAAMSPASDAQFGRVYSAENNLDYYALLDGLAARSSGTERDGYLARAKGVKDWFRLRAYDPVKGLFRRGGKTDAAGNFTWDLVGSLDIQSWAIAAFGPQVLAVEFGVDPDGLLRRTESAFAVSPSGVFGGDPAAAKGFDFSDAANAVAIGRPGMKWVEGTAQMILAYRLAADFYRASNAVLAARHDAMAAHFTARNAENAIQSHWGLTYPYADLPGIQIYAGTGNWKTFPGQAAPSAGWVYLAERSINPFKLEG